MSKERLSSPEELKAALYYLSITNKSDLPPGEGQTRDLNILVSEIELIIENLLNEIGEKLYKVIGYYHLISNFLDLTENEGIPEERLIITEQSANSIVQEYEMTKKLAVERQDEMLNEFNLEDVKIKLYAKLLNQLQTSEVSKLYSPIMVSKVFNTLFQDSVILPEEQALEINYKSNTDNELESQPVADNLAHTSVEQISDYEQQELSQALELSKQHHAVQLSYLRAITAEGVVQQMMGRDAYEAGLDYLNQSLSDKYEEL